MPLGIAQWRIQIFFGDRASPLPQSGLDAPPPPLLSEGLDSAPLPSCCSGDPKWQI